MCLFELRFSQGIFPVEGFLVQMVVLLLVSEGTSILFSIVTVSMYIPSNSFVFNKVYSPCIWAFMVAQMVKNLPAMRENCV